MPQKVPLKIFTIRLFRVFFLGSCTSQLSGELESILLVVSIFFVWIFTLKSWGNDPIWRAYFFVNGLVQPPTSKRYLPKYPTKSRQFLWRPNRPGVTLNCSDCKGILPKLAETFRLRIYNKLPRQKWFWISKTIFAGGFSGPGIIFGSGFVGDFWRVHGVGYRSYPLAPPFPEWRHIGSKGDTFY